MILRAAVNPEAGIEPVQNCQPAGAFRISVSVPAARSAVAPSVIKILPIEVHEGALPVAALLAQIFIPPVGAVIDTDASAAIRVQKKTKNNIRILPSFILVDCWRKNRATALF